MPANGRRFNPNSEIEDGRSGAFRVTHASGVWFSALRRKHRPANFPPSDISKTVVTKVRV
jgi:hypothetical protein